MSLLDLLQNVPPSQREQPTPGSETGAGKGKQNVPLKVWRTAASRGESVIYPHLAPLSHLPVMAENWSEGDAAVAGDCIKRHASREYLKCL